MALSDWISERIYNAFRINGSKDNQQGTDNVTVATTVEGVKDGISIETTSPDLVAAQLQASLDMIGLLGNINKELKKINLYNQLAHNQEVTNSDVDD